MEGKGSSTYSVIKIRLERVTMRNDTQGGMDLRYEIVCHVVSEGEREGRQRSVTEMLSHLKRGFEKGGKACVDKRGHFAGSAHLASLNLMLVLLPAFQVGSSQTSLSVCKPFSSICLYTYVCIFINLNIYLRKLSQFLTSI